MDFLPGLHGAVAVILLCALLFAEEAGVPLPFAPGEVTLVAAGLLIAAGGLDPIIFIPLAIIVCVAGAMVGYSWARLVGPSGLSTLAAKVHQEKALGRVTERVRTASPLGIALTRLIPGLRIYTTLVAGAVGIDRRVFVLGMAPATAGWVVVFVVLGAVVGLPIEHLLGQIEQVATQGAILVAMGVGGYIAIRRAPSGGGAGMVRLPRGVRIALAAGIDFGVVMSVVTGVLALARRFIGIGLGAGWIDLVVAVAVAGVLYVLITRRGAGATVGEALLQTSYATGRGISMRPRAAIANLLRRLPSSEPELEPTVAVLRALADTHRLRIVQLLIAAPHTVAELGRLIGHPEFEVRHQLTSLEEAGLLAAEDGDDPPRYGVRHHLQGAIVELVAATIGPGTSFPDGESAGPAPDNGRPIPTRPPLN